MATFKTPLHEVNISRYFPPTEPIEFPYITGATATYIVSTFGISVGYYLEDVEGGKVVNQLRVGDRVTATGLTEGNKPVKTAVLTCTGLNPLTFRGDNQDQPSQGSTAAKVIHIHTH